MQRRKLILASLASIGGVAIGGASSLAWAGVLSPTPQQAQGPFYPRIFPSDVDSDLTAVAGRSGVAYGDIALVSGKVVNENGEPLAGVEIEIWQVNGYGRYHHEGDDQDKPLDPNFQGYGRVTTAQDGAYSFRTVKPIAYPGRAPHIHFALRSPKGQKLITQMYVAGAPENERDFLLRRIRDKKLRDSLIVPLERATGGGELRGNFDIVLPGT